MQTEKKKHIVLGRYQVQKSKRSKCVTLPQAWAILNSVNAGDEVELHVEKNGMLRARKIKGAPKQDEVYRVQKTKTSLFVTLPQAWAVTNGIEAGDEVEFSIIRGTLYAQKVEDIPALNQAPCSVGAVA